jgi:hypothetical protein
MSSNEENRAIPEAFCFSKIILLGWHDVIAVGSLRGGGIGGTTNAKEEDSKTLQTTRMAKQHTRMVDTV